MFCNHWLNRGDKHIIPAGIGLLDFAGSVHGIFANAGVPILQRDLNSASVFKAQGFGAKSLGTRAFQDQDVSLEVIRKIGAALARP